MSLGRIETTLPAPAAGARSQRGTRPCFLCPLNRHLDLLSQQYLLMLPPQCVLEIPASSRHCHLSSQTQEKLGQARLPAEILQMASGQMRNPIAASSKVQHQAWPALPALSPAFLFRPACTALPSSSHCRVSARAALPRSSICFPQSAFFLSLPHSLCESHRARAVLLCPRSPAPSLAQSPGPQPPEDKAFPPVASPARRDSLFTSGFCAQCFCSLVSDSSRG